MLKRKVNPCAPWISVALLLGCIATPVAATPSDSTRTRGPRAIITEIGINTAIHSSESGVDATYMAIDVGYLGRTSANTLLGMDLSFTFHGDGSFWAIRPRVRRELNRIWGVDLAAGPIFAGNAAGHGLDGLGVSTIAVFHYRGFVGMTLGLQSVPYSEVGKYSYGPGQADPYSGRVTTTYVGLRVGKGPGIVVAAGVGLVVLAALSSLSN